MEAVEAARASQQCQETSVALVEKFKRDKDFFELVLYVSYMALGAIALASDTFGTKHAKLTISTGSYMHSVQRVYKKFM